MVIIVPRARMKEPHCLRKRPHRRDGKSSEVQNPCVGVHVQQMSYICCVHMQVLTCNMGTVHMQTLSQLCRCIVWVTSPVPTDMQHLFRHISQSSFATVCKPSHKTVQLLLQPLTTGSQVLLGQLTYFPALPNTVQALHHLCTVLRLAPYVELLLYCSTHVSVLGMRTSTQLIIWGSHNLSWPGCSSHTCGRSLLNCEGWT